MYPHREEYSTNAVGKLPVLVPPYSDLGSVIVYRLSNSSAPDLWEKANMKISLVFMDTKVSVRDELSKLSLHGPERSVYNAVHYRRLL